MYVLWSQDTRNAIVVDPGMMTEAERSRISAFIADNRLNVQKILLTHIHVDHVASAMWLAGETGADICACADDEFLANAMPEQVQRFHLPIEVPQVKPDEWLRDGDVLYLDDEPIKVLHTPGHTPGGLSFYLPVSGVVLAGDTLFAGSIGRTDLPGGDFVQLISSIKTKLLKLPVETLVLPGHGDSTTVGRELHFNPYLG